VTEWILRLACRKLAERLIAEHEAKQKKDESTEPPRPEPTTDDAEEGEAM
jgi:hypothetical protein